MISTRTIIAKTSLRSPMILWEPFYHAEQAFMMDRVGNVDDDHYFLFLIMR